MEGQSNADAALLGNTAAGGESQHSWIILLPQGEYQNCGGGGAHKLRNNGRNCLLGKQTKDHLPRPGRILSDRWGNKGCRMKGRARRVVGQPKEFKTVEKE